MGLLVNFTHQTGLMLVIYFLVNEVVESNSLDSFSARQTGHDKVSELREKRQTTRVLNGEIVAPHEFPQLALIFWEGKMRCQGTILTKDWILSSAFCGAVRYGRVPDLSTLRVIVGHHNISVREVSEQNLSVVDVILHQRYR